MNPRTNPYAPGAGTIPPELAGRDEIIEKAAIALDRCRNGLSSRGLLMVGLRGVGKTVLIMELINNIAKGLARLFGEVVAFKFLMRVPADHAAGDHQPARSGHAVGITRGRFPMAGMQKLMRAGHGTLP